MRPRRLKLGTHVDSGQMYRVYQNHAAALIRPFIFPFFFLCNFQALKFFVRVFSEIVKPRRLKLHTNMNSECIVYIEFRMLLLIHPFSSSFFFLSNFQILNIFVTLLLGTMRPRMLKLVTHVNNGWMYHVYQNQTAAPYSFLYFFIFLSLQFSNIKFFVALLSGIVSPRKLKLGTHMNNGWMYRVYRIQAVTDAYSSFFYFFISNFQRLKFFITLFSGTVRPRYWKLVTNVDCERMFRQ